MRSWVMRQVAKPRRPLFSDWGQWRTVPLVFAAAILAVAYGIQRLFVFPEAPLGRLFGACLILVGLVVGMAVIVYLLRPATLSGEVGSSGVDAVRSESNDE